MEQNFQTSFIPKKPMTPERVVRARPIGFFTIIAVLILFTVVVASGGLYFYKGVVTNSITKMENDLKLAKNRFEPAKITKLQELDKRLKASSEILSKHIAISPIFEILGDITMKTVRYTEFTYEGGNEKDTKMLISMKGEAVGYRSIALQSDLFAKENRIVDPVFSNLTLDLNGNVIFELQFSVASELVDYKSILGDTTETTLPVSNQMN